MGALRAFCFRHWPAMLVVAVLMFVMQLVGCSAGTRSVQRWVAGGEGVSGLTPRKRPKTLAERQEA